MLTLAKEMPVSAGSALQNILVFMLGFSVWSKHKTWVDPFTWRTDDGRPYSQEGRIMIRPYANGGITPL